MVTSFLLGVGGSGKLRLPLNIGKNTYWDLELDSASRHRTAFRTSARDNAFHHCWAEWSLSGIGTLTLHKWQNRQTMRPRRRHSQLNTEKIASALFTGSFHL